jgi:hypothetical protein
MQVLQTFHQLNAERIAQWARSWIPGIDVGPARLGGDGCPESPVSIGKRIPGRQALPWHHERPRQVSPTCFIRACHMCHDQFMSATTLSRVPGLIHVYHDSFMYAMTHPSVS